VAYVLERVNHGKHGRHGNAFGVEKINMDNQDGQDFFWALDRYIPLVHIRTYENNIKH